MKKYLYILFFLVMLSVVSAVTITTSGYLGNFVQNQWNTSNSVENLTFVGGDNQTLYVQLPKYVNITSGYLNIQSVSVGNYCYQESTNTSNQTGLDGDCNLNYSGEYSIETGPISYFYINYTKPTAVSAIWQIRHGNEIYHNITLSDNCWDSYTNKVVLRISSDRNGVGNGDSNPECYNTTEWITLGNYSVFGGTSFGFNNPDNLTRLYDGNWDTGQGRCESGCPNSWVSWTNGWSGSMIYEEAMWWNIGQYSLNPYLEVGTTDGIYEWNYTGNFTGTNTTDDLSIAINTYLTTCTADSVNNCQVPVLFHSDTVGKLIVDVGNSINYSLLYNVTYNIETIEKTSNYFILNLFNNFTSSANFNYNNSIYSPSSAYSSGVWTFTSSGFNPDWVPDSVLNQSFPFFWNLTIDGDTANTSTYNQLVHKIYLNDSSSCTSPKTLNFSIRNSSNEALLSPSGLDIYFDVWYDDSAYSRNYTFSYTGSSSYDVCISPSWVNYTTNAQAQYSFGAFTDKLYYLTNAVLNNVTQYINLYFEDGSSQVQFTVIDLNDISLEDVTIQVMSYDVGSNTFTTTEILQTDDQGLAYGQLVLGNWYKFILTYNDVVVLETTPSIINSATRTFRVNLASNYLEDNYDVYGDMAHTLTFDNSTLTFDFTYAQADGTPVNVCLEVIKQNVMGNTLLTNTCPTAVASGTIFYTITENITGATYIANSYIHFGNNSNLITLDTLSVSFDDEYKEWGLEGVFVTFLLLVTVAMVGIWNPVVAVFLMLIGIIAAIVINIFYLSWGAIVALIIIGIIAMYRMNK